MTPGRPEVLEAARFRVPELTKLTGCIIAAVIAAAVTIPMYDRFWYPPDDGAYAHVAERILNGDVLNQDVQDVHAGYVNFANAAAMALFGPELLSLRLPLALLNILQAPIVFLLLRRLNAMLALAASAAVSSLSFVQFLNPTAHWYCLFIVLLLPLCLLRFPQRTWRQALALGVIVGAVVMFRQLTGAIVAISVWSWLMLQPGSESKADWTPRLLLGATALIISGYVWTQADLATGLLFGVWPVALLLMAASRTTIPTLEATRRTGALLLGMLLASLPLAAYHIYHGSLLTWFDDAVVSAFQIPQLSFVQQQSYTSLASLVIPNVAQWTAPAVAVNALFWFSLLALPALNGAFLIRHTLRQDAPDAGVPLLPWLASFYSLVALHYQIPIYLFYVAGLNAAALAMSAGALSGRARAVTAMALFAMSGVAIYFHAGQSLARGMDGLIEGVRRGTLVDCGLPRCGLRLEPADAEVHRMLVDRIVDRSSAADCILALPSNAELYFLAGRCNPTRFFNSALGLRTPTDVAALLSQLRSRPPAVLIYRPEDKYNGPLTQALAQEAARMYARHEKIEDFELYWDPIATERAAQ